MRPGRAKGNAPDDGLHLAGGHIILSLEKEDVR